MLLAFSAVGALGFYQHRVRLALPALVRWVGLALLAVGVLVRTSMRAMGSRIVMWSPGDFRVRTRRTTANTKSRTQVTVIALATTAQWVEGVGAGASAVDVAHSARNHFIAVSPSSVAWAGVATRV
ncbi:hypothetical protein ALI144C_42005 [Actinosynnema sp. ALI-1.44]|nr:hypothetical protein ALI144C_42005 [Actinosynnema sp. ALI-1.44]